MLALGEFKDKAAADKVLEKYKIAGEQSNQDQADIQEKAEDLEKESAAAARKADRFDLGEVFLEIALVISSLALLTRKRAFWYIGIASSIAGVAVAITGALLH